jgi:hypothetical protein
MSVRKTRSHVVATFGNYVLIILTTDYVSLSLTVLEVYPYFWAYFLSVVLLFKRHELRMPANSPPLDTRMRLASLLCG